MNPFEAVKEFQVGAHQTTDAKWELKSNLDVFRFRLIDEEFSEAILATEPDNLLKELCDLIYVAIGYAVTFGWDIEEAFKRVHESNMSKLKDATFREDGKLNKGPHYQPADLSDLVS